MSVILCPHCGHADPSLRLVCDNCYQTLISTQQQHPTAAPDAKSKHFFEGIAEFIFYSGAYPDNLHIDISGFLADLKAMKPELMELTIPERFLSPKLPQLDAPDMALDIPDLPDLDLPVVLSYLANLRIPQLDYAPALDFLASLELPHINLAALADLLPHIDLSNVDLPALAELLPHIDLSAIDAAVLGEVLSHVDLSAIDLSAFADLLTGIDWSALADGLSGIDLSVLADLLEGIDIS